MLRRFSSLAILLGSSALVACTSHVVSGSNTDGSGGDGSGGASSVVGSSVTSTSTGSGGTDPCGPPPGSGGAGGAPTGSEPGAPCDTLDAETDCIDSSVGGYEVCEDGGDGALVWSVCMQYEGVVGTSTGAGTPLVLVFDGAPVSFAASNQAFALVADACVQTDWPSARSPWLALDRDGSGAIEGGGELFGSMTKLASGVLAKNGFEALADLDDNHDGVIDAKDPSFAKLVVWADANADRASQAGELASVASKKIISIDLAYTVQPRCDARGNCERERASFTYEDASGAKKTGSVVDVWLAYQN